MEEEKTIRKQDTGFAQISNKILNDSQLSLKAKGLYAYMFSKPNGWQFSAQRIANENKDGVDSIYSAFNELLDCRVIERKKLNTGRFIYKLLIKPSVEKAKKGKSQLGKTATISNTDVLSNTYLKSNTNTLQPVGCVNEIAEIINLFKVINPLISFGNKTQRGAVEVLIKKFGFEELKRMVEMTMEIQGKEYAPTITTPYQFKEKIGAVKIYFDRQKSNKYKITSI